MNGGLGSTIAKIAQRKESVKFAKQKIPKTTSIAGGNGTLRMAMNMKGNA